MVTLSASIDISMLPHINLSVMKYTLHHRLLSEILFELGFKDRSLMLALRCDGTIDTQRIQLHHPTLFNMTSIDQPSRAIDDPGSFWSNMNFLAVSVGSLRVTVSKLSMICQDNQFDN